MVQAAAVKRDELKTCLKRLNVSPGWLQSLLGVPLDELTPAQDRCIRAMVLHPTVLKVVREARICFPDTTFLAVRPIGDDTGSDRGERKLRKNGR